MSDLIQYTINSVSWSAVGLLLGIVAERPISRLRSLARRRITYAKGSILR